MSLFLSTKLPVPQFLLVSEQELNNVYIHIKKIKKDQCCVRN